MRRGGEAADAPSAAATAAAGKEEAPPDLAMRSDDAVDVGGLAPTITLVDTDTQEIFSTQEATADFGGYHRHLLIRIEAPGGNLSCQLEGPGRHTLSSPLQGQTLVRGHDLLVRWQTADGLVADEVDVHLSLAGYSVSLRQDLGELLIPTKLLRPGSETITVTRRNRLVPAGAAAASEIRMSYALAVTFQVL